MLYSHFYSRYMQLWCGGKASGNGWYLEIHQNRQCFKRCIDVHTVGGPKCEISIIHRSNVSQHTVMSNVTQVSDSCNLFDPLKWQYRLGVPETIYHVHSHWHFFCQQKLLNLYKQSSSVQTCTSLYRGNFLVHLWGLYRLVQTCTSLHKTSLVCWWSLGPIHSMIPILQLCEAHKAKYILFNDIFNDAVKHHQGNMLN